MAEPAQRVPPDLQAAELVPGNISAGIRLWAGATAFFFLGPLLAYLYLRSLNSFDQWRPAGIDPPQALGALTMALAAASSVLLVLAAQAFGGSAHRRWLPLGWVAVALGLASVALQVVTYAAIDFGPMDGGYASVFVAWTGLYALFVLATMIWLETLVAYGLRVRRQPAPAEEEAAALIAPRLSALAFYWAFLAALGILMWIFLYLV